MPGLSGSDRPLWRELCGSYPVLLETNYLGVGVLQFRFEGVNSEAVTPMGRLQKFALEHKLLDKPVFGNLEKPRVGQRDRVPTSSETEAILARGSPEFRLIYSALRQCGARPNELCRATIADVDRVNRVITLRGCEKIEPGGLPN